jgi:hypothetical protein
MPKVNNGAMRSSAISMNSSIKRLNRIPDGTCEGGDEDNKYQTLMNFDTKVMKQEFEKAERMLKKTDRLIEKYKDKSSPLPKKLTVKFALPDV